MNVEELVKEKENKDLDFKLELPESKKAAQLVTAFYNSRGGKIILGVEDKSRKPIGIKEPQKTEHRFTQIIRHWCKLDEEPKIEFIKYKNKDLIIIHCPKGKDTPYFVRGESKPRVRIGSSNVVANKEEIARLYREGSSRSFDIETVPKADINDLNLKAIKQYLKESHLTNKLNEKHFFEVISKEGFVSYNKNTREYVPTYAGILLFGKHPQINIPYSTILADRYKGIDMVEWIDKNEFNGNLFELIDKCENFFLRNMKTAAKAVGFRTEHKTEYPIDALKEALINALVHRDYLEKENIMIRMFDNRIEIISPGELLRPLTIENLENLNYKPKSRNKIIVDVFLRRKLMDKRGSGILRMREAMKEWKLPEPRFEENTGYFVITFKGPSRAEKPLDEEILRDLNERQKKALSYIKDKGRITSGEYGKLNNVVKNTAYRDLMELLGKDIIKQKGIGRGIYYVFK